MTSHRIVKFIVFCMFSITALSVVKKKNHIDKGGG